MEGMAKNLQCQGCGEYMCCSRGVQIVKQCAVQESTKKTHTEAGGCCRGGEQVDSNINHAVGMLLLPVQYA
jgi:hypothetical protein